MTAAVGDIGYDVEVRRTTHGVAHIRGSTLGDLGFGQGYACAADHLPTIADQILKVRSERAAFLGPGPAGENVDSDFGYLALGVDAWATTMARSCSDEVLAMVHGYAAGINRWLSDHGTSGLPPWCRNAEWVRPVSHLDLFALYADTALMGSGRNLVGPIGSAAPPGDGPDVAGASPRPAPPMPEDLPSSNGWAFGSEVTSHGGGMVVANPHFPWYGDGRFWECHLTVPGRLDVYGAALVGTPGVQIGFNRDVAWTHTFSRGHRFVIYQLELVADDPTAYRFGTEHREMVPTDHQIDVAMPDGTTHPVTRRLWASHHGPMVNIPLLGWGEAHAFSLRDANDGSDRFLPQYLAMNQARTIGEIREAIREHQGLPWVNVIAADRFGDVYYSDPSPVPNLSEEVEARYEAAVDDDVLTSLFASQRVALLDGSDPTTEWVDDPTAHLRGTVGPDRWPEMLCTDVAFNSNDPYWVAHPTRVLDKGPTLAGLHGRALSPRTRMNAAVLGGWAPASPAVGRGWTAADAERALLDNRSLLAEQLLDDVVERLRSAPGEGTHDSECLVRCAEILASWDRTFDLDAVGAVLWREFLGQFSDDELRWGGRLFRQPFDPGDPTRTPAGLAPVVASGPDPVTSAVEAAVAALRSAGIEPDARLGEVQYIDRGGARIALHGANEVEGIINVVAPIGNLVRSDLEPPVEVGGPIAGRTERTGLREGGYPITYGASFLMICTLGPDGPVARGLLAYGQSGDPVSPHHSDQTRAFSEKQLRPMLFHDDDITADPALSTLTLTQ